MRQASGSSRHLRHRGHEEPFERRCMPKAAEGHGGKGKAPVDDTTVRKKTKRAMVRVNPGGGEASGERSVLQAAAGTRHGLVSMGQCGAAGGHGSQPPQPALPAAPAAGRRVKRKAVEMNARDAETFRLVQEMISSSSSSSSSNSMQLCTLCP